MNDKTSCVVRACFGERFNEFTEAVLNKNKFTAHQINNVEKTALSIVQKVIA